MKAKTTKKAVASKRKLKSKRVAFALNAQQARDVSLAGDFTGWKGVSLKKGKDGVWKKVVLLKPGRYEYKFLVDGEWQSDPNNNNIAYNVFGTENSVVEL